MIDIRDGITIFVLFLSLYFEIFLLITYLEKWRVMHNQTASPVFKAENMPSVTIVVPIFNEEHTVSATIQSLLDLDYPKDKLRITIVNDGSTDNSAQMLQKFASNPQIDIFHKENGGKHTAVNLGIKRADTEFVGCLDADSYATKESLLRIMRRFNNPKVMAVVPSMQVHSSKTLIQKMQKVEYLIGIFFRSMLAELNALYVTPGPLSIFRKSVFESIGYYKKAYNTEDMEMALRMQLHRMKIGSAHDAVVFTSSPRTVRKLYVQRVRWVSGFLNNMRDYRSMLFNLRYGHAGGFVLPVMLVSTCCVIFLVVNFCWSMVTDIHSWIIRFEVLGSKALEWSWPSFNLFYIRITPIALGGIVAILAMLTFVIIGTKLAKGNKPNLFEIACYACLYALIAPFWIMKSVFNVTFSRKVAWR